MRRILLLTAIFLSGCAEVQQTMKNSIHLAYDYRNEYQPYSGDLDPNHLHQYSTICNQRSDEYKSNMIAREKAEFFRSDTVSYNCREGLGNDINCRASNNDSRSKILWRSREGVKQNEWTSLTEKYHQACMAEYGYKSVRVCFRNCEQPNQYEEKRTIGIDFEDLTVEERSFLGRNTGLKIVNIRLDSPAYYANVLVGDYLIFLDDQPTANVAQAMKMFQAIDWSKRSKTVLVVIRDNQEMDIEVDLASDRRQI